MQTFLVLGGSVESRKAYINSELTKLAIHPADHILPPTDIPTLGIAHIRDLIAHINLKPMVGERKALILDVDIISDEAQQALLKTLEEPPEDTFIFLSAVSDTRILPTIFSRCAVTTLQIQGLTLQFKYDEFWESLVTLPLLNRLVLIPDLGKERGDYQTFIQNNLLFLRFQLVESPQNDFSPLFLLTAIKQGLRALDALTHNCNSRLTFDIWLLSV